MSVSTHPKIGPTLLSKVGPVYKGIVRTEYYPRIVEALCDESQMKSEFEDYGTFGRFELTIPDQVHMDADFVEAHLNVVQKHLERIFTVSISHGEAAHERMLEVVSDVLINAAETATNKIGTW